MHYACLKMSIIVQHCLRVCPVDIVCTDLMCSSSLHSKSYFGCSLLDIRQLVATGIVSLFVQCLGQTTGPQAAVSTEILKSWKITDGDLHKYPLPRRPLSCLLLPQKLKEHCCCNACNGDEKEINHFVPTSSKLVWDQSGYSSEFSDVFGERIGALKVCSFQSGQ